MATNAAANKAEDYLGDAPTSTTNKPILDPNATMKALAWFGKQDLRLIDSPVPRVTDPTDAVVRITGSTVCGSDLHLLHGDIIQLKKGDILGHEYMGIIDEVGSAVTKFKKGDRVVASFNIGCGSCDNCKKGLFTMCDTTNNNSLMDKLYGGKLGGIAGYGHFGGGFAGGQAEFCRQPFADTNLLKIDGDVTDEQALYLSDIVCTAYHAVVRSGATEGETVGIWGLGPIGLHVAQWLRYKGVKRIIAVDNVPERLALAKEKWGVEGINFDVDTDVVTKIHELSPGGLDRAIDCAAFRYAKSMLHKVQRAVGLETDTSEIVNECIRSVKKFGTIALIADYALTCNGFLIGPVMEKGIALVGCGQAPVQKYWHELLQLIREGKFDPLVIVTHRFRLEDIVAVYDKFDKKAGGMMKVFLETRFSNPPSPGAPKLSDIKAV
ncbi:hypothetical protein HDU87_001865 [Geranomyces variabilis]|uniref:GroES-like protein n=1 Tax=Geranomyces variabilis TaxID=109894 RepID=A0AAD5XSH2_9FUNG|nr:hypothetical protein HDU87_001865 [Geranomyces variabilis]